MGESKVHIWGMMFQAEGTVRWDALRHKWTWTNKEQNVSACRAEPAKWKEGGEVRKEVKPRFLGLWRHLGFCFEKAIEEV